jgi:hypothetical protein
MPLSCDCYGGCWGDHSASWPRLSFNTEAVASEAARRCHQVADSYDQKLLGRIEYGTYVLVGKELRFETEEVKARWAKYNTKFMLDPEKHTREAEGKLRRATRTPLRGR